MAIEVHEGQAAVARQMAQAAALSSRITAVMCVCARGQICGPTTRHLEKKYLVPISARDRDETPFFGGFSDLGNCKNQHSSSPAVYTDLTLGESCIDQDLWPTLG